MAFTKEKIETILQEVKENLRFSSSELPSTLSSRYLQVENDVKSDILLDRAKKVLKHGMKHSNFHMWSNESSLRVYVPEFDRYMLKSKKTTLHDGKQFQRMLRHLRSIIYLLEHKLYSTRRDFYYTDTELFNNKQVCSDQALEAVALLLLCHRDSLPVYNAMSRGSVVGNLTFKYKVLQTAGNLVYRVLDDGEPGGFSYQIREKVLSIDARDSDIFGHDIPILVDKITCLNSKEALFILVVESKAILVSLYSAGFQQRFRCIIITGSGVPDVASRKFLRKTSLGLKLPVLALVDGDAYGFKILTIYNKGSEEMACCNEGLTTPNIYWLGVRPSDINRYTIPASCIKSLDENELKEVQLLIEKPFMDKHPRWKELEEMVKRKEKIDLKSTNKIAMDWLAEYYLPSKLEKKDWIL